MRIDELRADGGERSVRVAWEGGDTRLSVTVPPEVQWLRTEPEVVVVTLTRDTGEATPLAEDESPTGEEEPTPP